MVNLRLGLIGSTFMVIAGCVDAAPVGDGTTTDDAVIDELREMAEQFAQDRSTRQTPTDDGSTSFVAMPPLSAAPERKSFCIDYVYAVTCCMTLEPYKPGEMTCCTHSSAGSGCE